MTPRGIAAAVAVVFLATSCASAVPAATTAPSVDEQMVVFEARWLCEVQRRAFPSLDAMDAARADELDAAGVSATEYHSFQARLSEDTTLRSRVSDSYDEICP